MQSIFVLDIIVLHYALQRQNAVTAHLKSEQLLPFAFAVLADINHDET